MKFDACVLIKTACTSSKNKNFWVTSDITFIHVSSSSEKIPFFSGVQQILFWNYLFCYQDFYRVLAHYKRIAKILKKHNVDTDAQKNLANYTNDTGQRR